MYSTTQVNQVKSVINQHFDNPQVYEKLKQRVQQMNLKIEDMDNEKLIEILKETDLLDQILVDINKMDLSDQDQLRPAMKPAVEIDLENKNQKTIGINILNGKAFLNYINNKSLDLYFEFYLNFQNQQYVTEMIPASNEPKVNQTFYFNLQNDLKPIDLLTLTKLDSQVELVVVEVNLKNEQRQVISVKSIEWRFLLSYGSIKINIELKSFNEKQKQSIGILQVQMDLFPKTSLQLVPERILNDQLNKEKKFKDIDALKFYEYSTEWWNDYKQISKNFEQRAVKIYAENEDGIIKPVFTYVTPLTSVRGIDSPYHAARFVSLIPYKRIEKPGGEKIEVWHKFQTFLARKSGDVEDHALLLCSLLLGLGLDAYVIVGSTGDGPHFWVMTKMSIGNQLKCTFWESLTGQHYEQKDPRVNGLYRRVGCLFNHEFFAANIQQNDLAFHIDMNLYDITKWKKMSKDQIQGLPSSQTQLRLLQSKFNVFDEEEKLEKSLQSILTEHRKVLGCITRFDQKLAHMLSPALANYEFERLVQKSFGQDEFQYAIKSYIPEGNTFKAFPIQFQHKVPDLMWQILKTSPVSEDIINTRGDNVYFAIKCKFVTYPCNIFAVWITLAVRYHQIN